MSQLGVSQPDPKLERFSISEDFLEGLHSFLAQLNGYWDRYAVGPEREDQILAAIDKYLADEHPDDDFDGLTRQDLLITKHVILAKSGRPKRH